ncbi:MAG: TusE/DsrC/DsvC family sulfur relay protein [Pseudomonadota bacterium]|jgi:tRNA 2-thiouridine synthesizing protein E
MQMPDVDDEGYLIDPSIWSEALAQEFASQENIQLTEDHWDAIRFMRDYYAEHQVAPDVRHVMKHLAVRLGAESRNRIATARKPNLSYPLSK